MTLTSGRGSDFEHKAVLTTVGLALEDMGTNKEVHTVNKIAEKAHRHHRTVQRALEEIYYTQNFIPEIDLLHEEGKMSVHIKDLPKYVRMSSEPEDALLIKLFHAKAYFGHRIPISILNLSKEEMIHIKKVALSGIAEWVVVDNRNRTIGLTIEGSKRAFKKVEELSNIRDTTITNPAKGAVQLRARAKPPEEAELSINEFIAVIKAVGIENVRRHSELIKVLPSILTQMEHTQSVMEQAQHTLGEIRDFLYKHQHVGRPSETFIRRT